MTSSPPDRTSRPRPRAAADCRRAEEQRVDRELALIIAHANPSAQFLRSPLFVLRTRAALTRGCRSLEVKGYPFVNRYGAAALGVIGVTALCAGAGALVDRAFEAPAQAPVDSLADRPLETALMRDIRDEERPAAPTTPKNRPKKTHVTAPPVGGAHVKTDDLVDVSIKASVTQGVLSAEVVIPDAISLSISANTQLDAAAVRLLDTGRYEPRHSLEPSSTAAVSLSFLGLPLADIAL